MKKKPYVTPDMKDLRFVARDCGGGHCCDGNN